MVPLTCSKRLHGVLALACPEPPNNALKERLAYIATSVSLHIVHAYLDEAVSELRVLLNDRESTADALVRGLV